MKSKNITQLYDYFTNDQYHYIILEYCNNGNLMDLIEKNNFIIENQAIKIMIDIITGY